MRITYRSIVQKRTKILFCTFIAIYAIVALRLTYVQRWKADRYVAFGREIRNRTLTIQAQRGVIYDRVGRELAINLRAASIFAHPRAIQDVEKVSFQLASLLGCEQAPLTRKLETRKEFVWLQRGANEEVGKRVDEAGLRGVSVTKVQKRIYPSGVDPSGNLMPSSVAAQVIGFTDVDGVGAQGIEKVAERFLKGKDGFVVAEVDKDGRIIPETRRQSIKAHDGMDVTLTIDGYIQHVAEEALRKTFEASKAKGATAIVMDPRTGEVLAMANMPTFNPNRLTADSGDKWRNRAVTDLYEPGSTLKTVTAAAAIEEGVINSRTVFAHCSGILAVGKRRIRCVVHHPYESGHGAVDLSKMIEFSCNIGASQLGLKLGAERLYKYEEAFGLLARPHSGLPGEIAGRLDRPSEWPSIKCANVAFGQGIAITPLQITSAYAAIANRGVLMKPIVIREIRDKDGRMCREFTPTKVRQAVSEATADDVKKALISCVTDGTGKPGQVAGYSVAGKTGSAQKVRKDGRGYQPGAYVASFIGFLPASNPRLVILVVVDEPQGTHWGATVAAPAFKEIATKAMWYLRTPRDEVPREPNVRLARKTASA